MTIHDSVAAFEAVNINQSGNEIQFRMTENSADATTTINNSSHREERHEIPGVDVPGYFNFSIMRLNDRDILMTTDMKDKFGNRLFIKEKAFFIKGDWDQLVAGEDIEVGESPQERARVLGLTKGYVQRSIESELKARYSNRFNKISVLVIKFELLASNMTGNFHSLSGHTTGDFSVQVMLEE
jgi:hypothetical protein